MEDREALREAIRPPLLSDAESDEAQAGGLRAMRGGGGAKVAVGEETAGEETAARLTEAGEVTEGGVGTDEEGAEDGAEKVLYDGRSTSTCLLHHLLDALLPTPLHDALTAETPCDLASLPTGTLDPLPEELLHTASSGEAAEEDPAWEDPATAGAPEDDAAPATSGFGGVEKGGVIVMGVFNANPRGMPKFLVVDDKGETPDMYISKRLLEKMQKVRRIDEADLLSSKLEKRNSNLVAREGGGPKQYRNTGTFVFADTSRVRKDRAQAPRRVWVSMRGGVPREPTEAETRSATLRVLPPQLIPRTKRNW